MISISCIVSAHNITAPIIIRFFQGVRAALMMVPCKAMLNDTFDGLQLKKHYIYITTSFAFGPIIAPFIGGYLLMSIFPFAWFQVVCCKTIK